MNNNTVKQTNICNYCESLDVKNFVILRCKHPICLSCSKLTEFRQEIEDFESGTENTKTIIIKCPN